MKKIILFIVMSISFLSCKKRNDDDTASVPKIHALFSEHLPSGGAKLSLWKDGVFSTVIEQDEAALSGLSVTDNGDIFICGYQPNPSGSDIAKFWINGVATTLSTLPSDANDIQVVSNDIYVAGREGSKAVVWKNGSPAFLTNGIYQAVANSLFVNGTDVYVGGYTQNSSLNSVAQIWKNNLLVSTLSDGSKDANVRSIFVNGTDIYACGYDYYSSNLKRPVLWKNGVKSYLGANGGDAHEVIVHNNDVYVAGSESNVSNTDESPRAKYWKNGVPVLLGSSSYSAECTSIKIVAQDVYCAGSEQATFGSNTVAKYWKNGEPFTFKNTTNNTSVSRIVVK
jgi:hypothetical protein